MKAWYLSKSRFEIRIRKHWEKKGFKYNAGNINILKYSFRTLLYWSNFKNQKVSKINKVDVNPTLF